MGEIQKPVVFCHQWHGTLRFPGSHPDLASHCHLPDVGKGHPGLGWLKKPRVEWLVEMVEIHVRHGVRSMMENSDFILYYNMIQYVYIYIVWVPRALKKLFDTTSYCFADLRNDQDSHPRSFFCFFARKQLTIHGDQDWGNRHEKKMWLVVSHNVYFPWYMG